ncbi:glycosyltransferase family 39 protein [Patescibacteria group bacterium]|nr:glycosyltransferase family 39 protein [Patescibacteria group bacterium]
MIGILILGVFLSLINIGKTDIHNDEAILIFTSQQNLHDQIQLIKTTEYNPPLYNIILYVWGIFGQNISWFRILSAIIYALLLFYVYKLSAILFNKKVGLTASLLVALSYKFLFYAGFVKHYILITLLSVISLYFFVQLLKNIDNKKNKIYFVAFSVLSLYTSYFFSLIILVQILYLLIKKRKLLRKKLIKLFLLIFILSLPLLPLFITHFNSFLNENWIGSPFFNNIPLAVYYLTGENIILSIILSILLLISLITGFRDNGDSKNSFLLTCLYLFVPVIIIFLMSITVSSAFLCRYLLMFFIGFYILIARGLVGIKNNYISIFILGLIVILSLSVLNIHYRDMPTGIKKSSDFILSNFKNGDAVVHLTTNSYWPERFYNKNHTERVLLTEQELKKYNSGGYLQNFINIQKDLSFINDYQRIWFIEFDKFAIWNIDSFKHNPALGLINKWSFDDKNLYLYKIIKLP